MGVAKNREKWEEKNLEARQQLLQEIGQLEQKQAELQSEIDTINASESIDREKYNKVRAELDEVQSRLEQKQSALKELTEKVETQVAEAQAQIAQSFEAITAGDQTVTLRELANGEAAYQILSVYFQQLYLDQAEKIASLQIEAAELRRKNAELEYALEDMTVKRDAAAEQLQEAQVEIKRLNDQVQELRTEIAIGARNAVKVVETNVTANLSELMRQYKESRPAIYDLEALDGKRSQYKAKLAETGEEITFGYLELGKYREVSAEEAESFRNQHKAQKAQLEADNTNDTALGGDLTPPAVTFPADSETAAGELAQGNTNGEVATAATLEERVARLEAAVFGKVGGAA
ncbi:hypothetical protein [Paenibacillus cisolokensis]|uniref:hypothetical protein n=1 Tax=Paenibacillus cisolokensis TaxID=1658519 RepID=UPI001BCB21B7|nr:hypothetical protein [Paenibacillus cisolokensis]